MKLSSRVAIYARVSSEQQAQHNTIASQLGNVPHLLILKGPLP